MLNFYMSHKNIATYYLVKKKSKDRTSCGIDTGISKQVYTHSEIPESHLIIYFHYSSNSVFFKISDFFREKCLKSSQM